MAHHKEALLQHAEQLAKFAGFRYHNSPSGQLFRHRLNSSVMPKPAFHANHHFRDYAETR